MNQILIKKVSQSSLKSNVPDVRPGQTLRIHQKISEGGKDRVQIFEGLVIKVSSGHGINKTFTVRKIVSGVGVEKIFPLHTKSIEKIEVVKQAKVRRAKLLYMRDLTGKSARLREKYYGENDEIALDASSATEDEILTEDPNTVEEETPKVEEVVEEAKEEVVEESPAKDEEATEEVAEDATEKTKEEDSAA